MTENINGGRDRGRLREIMLEGLRQWCRGIPEADQQKLRYRVSGSGVEKYQRQLYQQTKNDSFKKP